jgi:hypothetical protein
MQTVSSVFSGTARDPSEYQKDAISRVLIGGKDPTVVYSFVSD